MVTVPFHDVFIMSNFLVQWSIVVIRWWQQNARIDQLLAKAGRRQTEIRQRPFAVEHKVQQDW